MYYIKNALPSDKTNKKCYIYEKNNFNPLVHINVFSFSINYRRLLKFKALNI